MVKIIGILLLILMGALVYIIRLRKTVTQLQRSLLETREIVEKHAKATEQENQLIIMNQKIKYNVLQNQINPHFLYNTLENIRGRAIIDENLVIADMTEALARYFRYNISKDGDMVTLVQEIENIQTYIQIQHYRFGDRIVFQVSNHVSEEVLRQCTIPKMTLQPIIENAIFYGVENKLEQSHVNVDLDVIGGCASIIVSDDGLGMKKEQLEQLNNKIQRQDETKREQNPKGNGIALRNINKRIQLIYGDEFGLRVSSIWNVGTQVEVTFPFVLKEAKG